jgi:hypothetical protein
MTLVDCGVVVWGSSRVFLRDSGWKPTRHASHHGLAEPAVGLI